MISINLTAVESRVVVTGASGGIGEAIAERLARDGFNLILIDRSQSKLEELQHRLSSASNLGHQLIEADFSDGPSFSKCLEQISHRGIPIRGLVNVAGVNLDAPFLLTSEQSIEKTFRINYTTAIRMAQHVSRMMARAGGGSIVNISSITGLIGNRGQLAYGASKAALINSTITMSMELGDQNIRVNAVAPGVISTEMTLQLPEEVKEELARRPFMGRLGNPSEIASVVSWLLSDNSSYVTGETIRVDGCI